MPHVNHRRGETGRFVYRREHGRMTHFTYHKGKSDSARWYKTWINRTHRANDRRALQIDWEDPFDRRRRVWSLGWYDCL